MVTIPAALLLLALAPIATSALALELTIFVIAKVGIAFGPCKGNHTNRGSTARLHAAINNRGHDLVLCCNRAGAIANSTGIVPSRLFVPF
jgi:hypothetical protein